jgi:hypothetical protein
MLSLAVVVGVVNLQNTLASPKQHRVAGTSAEADLCLSAIQIPPRDHSTLVPRPESRPEESLPLRCAKLLAAPEDCPGTFLGSCTGLRFSSCSG